MFNNLNVKELSMYKMETSKKTTFGVCSPRLEPAFIGDIEKLELVQKRTQKFPEGLKNLNYGEILRLLDMIQFNNIHIKRDLLELKL